MASVPVLIGTVVAVGLALGIGVGCRSKSCASSTPTPVTTRELVRSTTSGVQDTRLVVARDAAAWGELWAAHSRLQLPAAPAPSVDFGAEMVVAYFAGSKPTGGFDVSIDAVERTPEGLVVRATATKPAADAMLVQMLTSPMHAVAVPRCEGEPTLALAEAP